MTRAEAIEIAQHARQKRDDLARRARVLVAAGERALAAELRHDVDRATLEWIDAWNDVTAAIESETGIDLERFYIEQRTEWWITQTEADDG